MVVFAHIRLAKLMLAKVIGKSKSIHRVFLYLSQTFLIKCSQKYSHQKYFLILFQRISKPEKRKKEMKPPPEKE